VIYGKYKANFLFGFIKQIKECNSSEWLQNKGYKEHLSTKPELSQENGINGHYR
jgi:hypothetical protein